MNDPPFHLHSFLGELKRRRVYRVAVVIWRRRTCLQGGLIGLAG